MNPKDKKVSYDVHGLLSDGGYFTLDDEKSLKELLESLTADALLRVNVETVVTEDDSPTADELWRAISPEETMKNLMKVIADVKKVSS